TVFIVAPPYRLSVDRKCRYAEEPTTISVQRACISARACGPCRESLSARAVPSRNEIDVHLFPGNERTGVGQIHEHLKHVHVIQLARAARIDPAGADHAPDGCDLSLEGAI